jgi:hypothetical protein
VENKQEANSWPNRDRRKSRRPSAGLGGGRSRPGRHKAAATTESSACPPPPGSFQNNWDKRSASLWVRRTRSGPEPSRGSLVQIPTKVSN